MCSHCNRVARFTNNQEVLQKPYGAWPYIWLCDRCGAYVSCHPGTRRPKGTLADRKTRAARVRAHQVFDPFWRDGRQTRAEAYAWLAEKLGLTSAQAHIGRLTLAQCNQVIQLCEERKKVDDGTA
jgi:hypothetical protein